MDVNGQGLNAGECPQRANIQYKYAIGVAMRNSQRPLGVSEIYDFVKVHMPKICTYKNKSWENCIRGHVTKCNLFLKITTIKKGKVDCKYTFRDEGGWARQFSQKYGTGDDFLTFPYLHRDLYYGKVGFPSEEDIKDARIRFEHERAPWRQQRTVKQGKPKEAQMMREAEEEDEPEQYPQQPRNLRGPSSSKAYERHNSKRQSTSRRKPVVNGDENNQSIDQFARPEAHVIKMGEPPAPPQTRESISMPLGMIPGAMATASTSFVPQYPLQAINHLDFLNQSAVPSYQPSPFSMTQFQNPTLPQPMPMAFMNNTGFMQPHPYNLQQQQAMPIADRPQPIPNGAQNPYPMVNNHPNARPIKQEPSIPNEAENPYERVNNHLNVRPIKLEPANPNGTENPYERMNNHLNARPIKQEPSDPNGAENPCEMVDNYPPNARPIKQEPANPNGTENPYEMVDNHLNARPIKQEPSDPNELNNHGFVQPPVRYPHNPPQPTAARPQPNTNGAQNPYEMNSYPPNSRPIKLEPKQEPPF